MMEVLLAIHNKPGITQPELIEGEGKATKFKRLQELCDVGFVNVRLSSAPRRNSIVYFTTDKGKNAGINIADLFENDNL